MHHLQHISELTAVLKRTGASEVIIAPGSRNAPLIQLFTSHEGFRCHSIVDERSAGYLALGMARQTDRPVVVVTTSGTAVLNLSPAVAEAFHQRIPLVILTADRPFEKLPQFNNQVSDQNAPYFNHSKGFLEFPAQVRTQEDLERKFHTVEGLLAEALKEPRGPVHINLPLTEPLYVPLPGPVLAQTTERIRPRQTGPDMALPEVDLSDKKVLVLAGMGMGPEKINQALEELVDHGQVVAVAENIANLHSGSFVSVPELVLAGAHKDELKKLAPDVLFAFGQQVVSKRLKQFLYSLDKTDLVVIPEDVSIPDALGVLGDKLDKKEDKSYLSHWLDIQQREVAKASAFFHTAPFCNLVVVHRILERVPSGTVVHLGNSATIRNSQLFPSRSGLKYLSNRGISGIDGSLSTAVGAAMVSEDPHLLLLGDLSFVYDSNALWNKDFPGNLKIVVLNDGGGGIFRLLDGPDQMDFFEEFSVTHHPVSLELLSQSFGRGFQRVRSLDSLEEQLESLFSEGNALSVLEVDTTSAENSRIFKELFS